MANNQRNKVKQNRQRGKNAEKRVAKFFNGIRLGILGKEDVITDKFSIEVKSREKLSFEKYYYQSVKNNEKRKIPLLFMIKKHQKISEGYIIIKAKDFKKLLS